MDGSYSYIIVICLNCKYQPALDHQYTAQFNMHRITIICFEFTILMQFCGLD